MTMSYVASWLNIEVEDLIKEATTTCSKYEYEKNLERGNYSTPREVGKDDKYTYYQVWFLQTTIIVGVY